jgi:amidase
MENCCFIRCTAIAALPVLLIGCGLHAIPSPGAPARMTPNTVVTTTSTDVPTFDEASIAQLQSEMGSGRLTAHALTAHYLTRIDALDRNGPQLHAVIEVNPDALAIADALDVERKAGHVRGPLHGIPVLIKDNIATADAMQTTAGSLALVGHKPPHDAFIVSRLRDAGAVILGKTNLSEWANWRSTHATSGWSGRGGQTRNPYALDRNPCGSSAGSGAAIAANLAVVAVGTETDGSIVCPSSINGLVGIKPTLGTVSRSGIIPIAASQDTAGPMARSVADAAILLDVLAASDPEDVVTAKSRGRAPKRGFAGVLDGEGLKGARIGVIRKLAGFHPEVDTAFDAAIEALKKAGATVIDDVTLPYLGKYDDDENAVLQYEFKDGIARYLATLIDPAAPRTLADLIAFNTRESSREMPLFEQELFDQSEARGPLSDADYRKAHARALRLAGRLGIDAALKSKHLDALIAPTIGPAWVNDYINGDHYLGGTISQAPAIAGYPHVTVPMGAVRGLPVGLSFVGPAWSDAKLIRYADTFERATRARRPPDFRATVATVEP